MIKSHSLTQQLWKYPVLIFVSLKASQDQYIFLLMTQKVIQPQYRIWWHFKQFTITLKLHSRILSLSSHCSRPHLLLLCQCHMPFFPYYSALLLENHQRSLSYRKGSDASLMAGLQNKPNANPWIIDGWRVCLCSSFFLFFFCRSLNSFNLIQTAKMHSHFGVCIVNMKLHTVAYISETLGNRLAASKGNKIH